MTHDLHARQRDTVLAALRALGPDLPDDLAARGRSVDALVRQLIIDEGVGKDGESSR